MRFIVEMQRKSEKHKKRTQKMPLQSGGNHFLGVSWRVAGRENKKRPPFFWRPQLLRQNYALFFNWLGPLRLVRTRAMRLTAALISLLLALKLLRCLWTYCFAILVASALLIRLLLAAAVHLQRAGLVYKLCATHNQ